MALVCNPYTPVPIAIRLVSTLLKQDLGDLATSAALPGALLEAVRVELDGRSRLGDRPGTPER